MLFVKEFSFGFFCRQAFCGKILFLKMKKKCVMVNPSRSPDVYIVFFFLQ
jgi:hypothetical protein